MGDTFHDPIDHLRTTQPHAGRAVIDVLGWPGYALLVLGMLAGAGCPEAFGTGHHFQGAQIAVGAVISAVIGTLWLVVEHKRIGRVADRWHTAHPEEHRQAPSH